ncbi:MAG: glutamate racemase [Candidatus Saccharimonadales bacterium]
MKIGVFDSGIGGKSVADALKRANPQFEVVFRPDSPDHFPYATKSPEQLLKCVAPVIQSLVDDECDAIIIACNTVSTTLISQLREMFVVPLVAVEPMVKPAAEQTLSKVIAVCATPTTLASERYNWLKTTYASQCQVIEPDCTEWSRLIEHNQINIEQLRADLQPAVDNGADVVVLGCTHYHWIEQEVRDLVGPNVLVLQPEQAVVKQLLRVLAPLL